MERHEKKTRTNGKGSKGPQNAGLSNSSDSSSLKKKVIGSFKGETSTLSPGTDLPSDSLPDVGKPYLPVEVLDVVDGIRPSSSKTKALALLPAIEEAACEENVTQEKEDGGLGDSPCSSAPTSLPSSPIHYGRQVSRVSSKPTLTSISEELITTKTGEHWRLERQQSFDIQRHRSGGGHSTTGARSRPKKNKSHNLKDLSIACRKEALGSEAATAADISTSGKEQHHLEAMAERDETSTSERTQLIPCAAGEGTAIVPKDDTESEPNAETNDSQLCPPVSSSGDDEFKPEYSPILELSSATDDDIGNKISDTAIPEAFYDNGPIKCLLTVNDNASLSADTDDCPVSNQTSDSCADDDSLMPQIQGSNTADPSASSEFTKSDGTVEGDDNDKDTSSLHHSSPYPQCSSCISENIVPCPSGISSQENALASELVSREVFYCVGEDQVIPMGDMVGTVRTLIATDAAIFKPAAYFASLNIYINQIVLGSLCEVIVQLALKNAAHQVEKTEKQKDTHTSPGDKDNDGGPEPAPSSTKVKGSGSDSKVADTTASGADVSAPRESHSAHNACSTSQEKQDKDYKDKEANKQRDKDVVSKPRGRERERNKRKRDREDRGSPAGKKSLRNAEGDVYRSEDDTGASDERDVSSQNLTANTRSLRRSQGVTSSTTDENLPYSRENKRPLEESASINRFDDSGDAQENVPKTTCGLEYQTVTTMADDSSIGDNQSSRWQVRRPNHVDTPGEEGRSSQTGQSSNDFNKTYTSRFGKRTSLHRQKPANLSNPSTGHREDANIQDLINHNEPEDIVTNLTDRDPGEVHGQPSGDFSREHDVQHSLNLPDFEAVYTTDSILNQANMANDVFTKCPHDVGQGERGSSDVHKHASKMRPFETPGFCRVRDESFNHPPKYQAENNPAEWAQTSPLRDVETNECTEPVMFDLELSQDAVDPKVGNAQGIHDSRANEAHDDGPQLPEAYFVSDSQTGNEHMINEPFITDGTNILHAHNISDIQTGGIQDMRDSQAEVAGDVYDLQLEEAIYGNPPPMEEPQYVHSPQVVKKKLGIDPEVADVHLPLATHAEDVKDGYDPETGEAQDVIQNGEDLALQDLQTSQDIHDSYLEQSYIVQNSADILPQDSAYPNIEDIRDIIEPEARQFQNIGNFETGEGERNNDVADLLQHEQLVGTRVNADNVENVGNLDTLQNISSGELGLQEEGGDKDGQRFSADTNTDGLLTITGQDGIMGNDTEGVFDDNKWYSQYEDGVGAVRPPGGGPVDRDCFDNATDIQNGMSEQSEKNIDTTCDDGDAGAIPLESSQDIVVHQAELNNGFEMEDSAISYPEKQNIEFQNITVQPTESNGYQEIESNETEAIKDEKIVRKAFYGDDEAIKPDNENISEMNYGKIVLEDHACSINPPESGASNDDIASTEEAAGGEGGIAANSSQIQADLENMSGKVTVDEEKNPYNEQLIMDEFDEERNDSKVKTGNTDEIFGSVKDNSDVLDTSPLADVDAFSADVKPESWIAETLGKEIPITMEGLGEAKAEGEINYLQDYQAKNTDLVRLVMDDTPLSQDTEIVGALDNPAKAVNEVTKDAPIPSETINEYQDQKLKTDFETEAESPNDELESYKDGKTQEGSDVQDLILETRDDFQNDSNFPVSETENIEVENESEDVLHLNLRIDETPIPVNLTSSDVPRNEISDLDMIAVQDNSVESMEAEKANIEINTLEQINISEEQDKMSNPSPTMGINPYFEAEQFIGSDIIEQQAITLDNTAEPVSNVDVETWQGKTSETEANQIRILETKVAATQEIYLNQPETILSEQDDKAYLKAEEITATPTTSPEPLITPEIKVEYVESPDALVEEKDLSEIPTKVNSDEIIREAVITSETAINLAENTDILIDDDDRPDNELRQSSSTEIRVEQVISRGDNGEEEISDIVAAENISEILLKQVNSSTEVRVEETVKAEFRVDRTETLDVEDVHISEKLTRQVNSTEIITAHGGFVGFETKADGASDFAEFGIASEIPVRQTNSTEIEAEHNIDSEMKVNSEKTADNLMEDNDISGRPLKQDSSAEVVVDQGVSLDIKEHASEHDKVPEQNIPQVHTTEILVEQVITSDIDIKMKIGETADVVEKWTNDTENSPETRVSSRGVMVVHVSSETKVKLNETSEFKIHQEGNPDSSLKQVDNSEITAERVITSDNKVELTEISNTNVEPDKISETLNKEADSTEVTTEQVNTTHIKVELTETSGTVDEQGNEQAQQVSSTKILAEEVITTNPKAEPTDLPGAAVEQSDSLDSPLKQVNSTEIMAEQLNIPDIEVGLRETSNVNVEPGSILESKLKQVSSTEIVAEQRVTSDIKLEPVTSDVDQENVLEGPLKQVSSTEIMADQVISSDTKMEPTETSDAIVEQDNVLETPLKQASSTEIIAEQMTPSDMKEELNETSYGVEQENVLEKPLNEVGSFEIKQEFITSDIKVETVLTETSDNIVQQERVSEAWVKQISSTELMVEQVPTSDPDAEGSDAPDMQKQHSALDEALRQVSSTEIMAENSSAEDVRAKLSATSHEVEQGNILERPLNQVSSTQIIKKETSTVDIGAKLSESSSLAEQGNVSERLLHQDSSTEIMVREVNIAEIDAKLSETSNLMEEDNVLETPLKQVSSTRAVVEQDFVQDPDEILSESQDFVEESGELDQPLRQVGSTEIMMKEFTAANLDAKLSGASEFLEQGDISERPITEISSTEIMAPQVNTSDIKVNSTEDQNFGKKLGDTEEGLSRQISSSETIAQGIASRGEPLRQISSDEIMTQQDIAARKEPLKQVSSTEIMAQEDIAAGGEQLKRLSSTEIIAQEDIAAGGEQLKRLSSTEIMVQEDTAAREEQLKRVSSTEIMVQEDIAAREEQLKRVSSTEIMVQEDIAARGEQLKRVSSTEIMAQEDTAAREEPLKQVSSTEIMAQQGIASEDKPLKQISSTEIMVQQGIASEDEPLKRISSTEIMAQQGIASVEEPLKQISSTEIMAQQGIASVEEPLKEISSTEIMAQGIASEEEQLKQISSTEIMVQQGIASEDEPPKRISSTEIIAQQGIASVEEPLKQISSTEIMAQQGIASVEEPLKQISSTEIMAQQGIAFVEQISSTEIMAQQGIASVEEPLKQISSTEIMAQQGIASVEEPLKQISSTEIMAQQGIASVVESLKQTSSTEIMAEQDTATNEEPLKQVGSTEIMTLQASISDIKGGPIEIPDVVVNEVENEANPLKQFSSSEIMVEQAFASDRQTESNKPSDMILQQENVTESLLKQVSSTEIMSERVITEDIDVKTFETPDTVEPEGAAGEPLRQASSTEIMAGQGQEDGRGFYTELRAEGDQSPEIVDEHKHTSENILSPVFSPESKEIVPPDTLERQLTTEYSQQNKVVDEDTKGLGVLKAEVYAEPGPGEDGVYLKTGERQDLQLGDNEIYGQSAADRQGDMAEFMNEMTVAERHIESLESVDGKANDEVKGLDGEYEQFEDTDADFAPVHMIGLGRRRASTLNIAQEPDTGSDLCDKAFNIPVTEEEEHVESLELKDEEAVNIYYETIKETDTPVIMNEDFNIPPETDVDIIAQGKAEEEGNISPKTNEEIIGSFEIDEEVNIPVKAGQEVDISPTAENDENIPLQTHEEVNLPLEMDEGIDIPSITEEDVNIPPEADKEMASPVRTDDELKLPTEFNEEVNTPVKADEELNISPKTNEDVNIPPRAEEEEEEEVNIQLKTNEEVEISPVNVEEISYSYETEQEDVNILPETNDKINIPVEKDVEVNISTERAEDVYLSLDMGDERKISQDEGGDIPSGTKEEFNIPATEDEEVKISLTAEEEIKILPAQDKEVSPDGDETLEMLVGEGEESYISIKRNEVYISGMTEGESYGPDEINDEVAKQEFISVVKDEQDKEEFISVVKDEQEEEEFILVVKDEQDKEEFISVSKDEQDKEEFISVVKDEQDVEEFISVVKDEQDKEEFICVVKDEQDNVAAIQAEQINYLDSTDEQDTSKLTEEHIISPDPSEHGDFVKKTDEDISTPVNSPNAQVSDEELHKNVVADDQSFKNESFYTSSMSTESSSGSVRYTGSNTFNVAMEEALQDYQKAEREAENLAHAINETGSQEQVQNLKVDSLLHQDDLSSISQDYGENAPGDVSQFQEYKDEQFVEEEEKQQASAILSRSGAGENMLETSAQPKMRSELSNVDPKVKAEGAKLSPMAYAEEREQRKRGLFEDSGAFDSSPKAVIDTNIGYDQAELYTAISPVVTPILHRSFIPSIGDGLTGDKEDEPIPVEIDSRKVDLIEQNKTVPAADEEEEEATSERRIYRSSSKKGYPVKGSSSKTRLTEEDDVKRKVPKTPAVPPSKASTDVRASPRSEEATSLTLEPSEKPLPEKTKSEDLQEMLKDAEEEKEVSEEGDDFRLRPTRSSPAPPSGVRSIKVVDVEEFPKHIPSIYHPDGEIEAAPSEAARPSGEATKSPALEAHRDKKSTLWRRFKSILRPPKLTRRDGKFKFVKKYKQGFSSSTSIQGGESTRSVPFTMSENVISVEARSSERTVPVGALARRGAISADSLANERSQESVTSRQQITAWHRPATPAKAVTLRNKTTVKRNQWRRFRRLRVLRHSVETMGARLPPVKKHNVSSKSYTRMRENKPNQVGDEAISSREDITGKGRRMRRHEFPLLEHPRDAAASQRCQRIDQDTPEVFEVFCNEDDGKDRTDPKVEPTVRMLMKPPHVKRSSSTVNEEETSRVAATQGNQRRVKGRDMVAVTSGPPVRPQPTRRWLCHLM